MESNKDHWFLGLVIPCVVVGYGIVAVARQSASMYTSYGWATVNGELAVAIGIACIGLGLFLHCYVWIPGSRTWRLYQLGEWIGILAFLVAFTYFVVRFTLTDFKG